jgi:phospholipid/cholesterol/gamma-HCH transport system substrate-binding protein
MKFKNEIKAGIIAIATLAAFFWGFNFLKGRNVLKETRIFYAKYHNVDGLTKGRPVTLNGLQIGSVADISFLPNMSGELVVKLEIDNTFPFSTNSLLKIYGADLMGAKSLSINVKEGQILAISGDTLGGVIDPSITTVLNDEVQPLKKKLENLMTSIDSTSANIRRLTGGENGKNIGKVIYNLNKNLENFAVVSGKLKNNSESIDSIFTNINSMSHNFKVLSDSLSKVNIVSTVNNINDVMSQLNKMLDSVNNGDGTLSKLLHDKALYDNLTASTKELHDLLEDLKLNPKRYVHVSVFGKKSDDYVKPEVDTLKSN